jgi:nucleoid DNA-binding protein
MAECSAGVIENGEWSQTVDGAPQGASASPLLANVYLHYVFDLWVEVWRRKVATGDVIVVRYADDLVMGFQHRTDAERFLQQFRERLARFGLELHPDKTRLIEFGRFAARDRKRRGARENPRLSRFWDSPIFVGNSGAAGPLLSGGLRRQSGWQRSLSSLRPNFNAESTIAPPR